MIGVHFGQLPFLQAKLVAASSASSGVLARPQAVANFGCMLGACPTETGDGMAATHPFMHFRCKTTDSQACVKMSCRLNS